MEAGLKSQAGRCCMAARLLLSSLCCLHKLSTCPPAHLRYAPGKTTTNSRVLCTTLTMGMAWEASSWGDTSSSCGVGGVKGRWHGQGG